ncbi:MAG: hypothetical protein LYZ66_00750 [Nitrososphaerales archaeon]|nr:hypothetical protein [Nitrososphaerales archaeon]
MRSQLFVGGIMVAIMGAALYVLEIPLVYFWSLPFVVGGGLMAGASWFLAESPGPVQPPEGYRFCVYCSAQVKLESERCPQCNGLQPKGGA